MKIRKAKKEDVVSITKLDKESTEYHKKFDKDFYTISEKWWKIKKDSQIRAVKDQTNLILIAEIDNKIVGYIWSYVEKRNNYKCGIIQELIVTSKQRGRGIGKELIKMMLAFLKKKGCTVSEIEVNVKNEPTMKLYEKSGFIKKEYKMRLILNKNKKFRPFY